MKEKNKKIYLKYMKEKLKEIEYWNGILMKDKISYMFIPEIKREYRRIYG